MEPTPLVASAFERFQAAEWHPVLPPEYLERIVEATPEWLAMLLVPLTHIGSVFVIAPLAVIAYLWAPRRFAVLLPAFFAYYGVMGGIKSMNDSVRPDVQAPITEAAFPAAYSRWVNHATGIGTTSFPSGNAMVMTIVVTILVVTLRFSTLRRRAAVGAAVVVMVGYSRLAMGVHYPVDVLAAFVLGIALAGTFLVVERLVWRRSSWTTATAATFALAAALSFVGVWLVSNAVGVPTWDGIHGSNRVLALGGAIGGCVTALIGGRTGWRFGLPVGRLERTLAIAVLVVLTYGVHLSVSHPLVSMLWAAVVFGAVLALPHVHPSRETVEARMGFGPPRTHSD